MTKYPDRSWQEDNSRMNPPTVSVLIPCYNSEATIGDTLEIRF